MSENALLSEEVKQKWEPVLEAEGQAPITDSRVKKMTTIVLENTQKSIALQEAVGHSGALDLGTATNAGGFDPVLISMIRRSMPSLIANELVGVQPMTAPTGLIFAMRAHYTGNATTGAEAFANAAPDAAFSGPVTTAAGEVLGTAQSVNAAAVGVTPVVQTTPWNEMSFSIEKVAIQAETRSLKAQYTLELAQDLKAVHGMDADAELASILSGEIVAEINRDLINRIRTQAIFTPGVANTAALTRAGVAIAPVATSTLAETGQFNMLVDADGRWSVERYKGLYLEIVREATRVAIESRRGVANILICSPMVLAGLETVAKLDTSSIALTGGQTDYVGTTFAGVLGGRFRVFVDPYAATDYITMGYKGGNVYDSGMFYCPYVPMVFMKATGQDDFTPRMGVKSRAAIASNPFAGANPANNNPYYRELGIINM
ncbi:MAG: ATP-binding protein [Ghiorsea sp.]